MKKKGGRIVFSGELKKKLRESFMVETRVKFDIPIPTDILSIKDIFIDSGYKLFIVGGAVRDTLLNKSPKDFDLVTDAKPDNIELILQKNGFKTLPTGKQFGVINVFTDSDEYEIATFRSDGEYTDGRRPDSITFGDITSDSKRRDLTINALYYDIDTNEIIDLVGGIKDIKNGVVRTVGSAEERFSEDRLRVLRAIRFAGRFGSDLDPAVDAALRKDNSLNKVSPERVRDEFLKGLKTAKSTRHFLTLIKKYDLFSEILPNLKVSPHFAESKEPLVIIALLLMDNEPQVLSKVLNKLTYSSVENKIITFLVTFSKFNDVNDVFKMKKLHTKSDVNIDIFDEFSEKANLNQKMCNAFINFELSVNGVDVEKLGVKKGPEMGKAIEKLEIENFKKLL